MLHSALEALLPAGGCAQGLGQTLRPERLTDTLRDGAVSAQSGAQSGLGGAWETDCLSQEDHRVGVAACRVGLSWHHSGGAGPDPMRLAGGRGTSRPAPGLPAQAHSLLVTGGLGLVQGWERGCGSHWHCKPQSGRGLGAASETREWNRDCDCRAEGS